jgi:aminotransferase
MSSWFYQTTPLFQDELVNLSHSARASLIIQSEIRNMSIECDRVNGINLSQGVCDLDLPLPVKSGARQAIESGVNHYTRYDGLPELREAIAHKLRKHNGIEVDPERNVIVSAGATGALYSACMALLNPGDQVILFEPYYGYHVNTFLAVNVVPVYAKLTPPDWTLDMTELESLVSVRTKGIMINTPANPSGKVFSREELEQLALFSEKHDLFIFTDEIYEYFVYDGHRHISPASMKGVSQRTISVLGYSKTFSITGWRIGYCVCDERWTDVIGYVNDLIYVCAPSPLQLGVAEGINRLGDDFYISLCSQYRAKRDRLCSTLTRIGLTPFIPQGAYYVLADVTSIPGKTGKEKAMYLLHKTGVASVPGEAFYHDGGGEHLVRFCFAKNDDVLNAACERLLRL